MTSNAYRSATTGDKGFMIEVDGKKYIELDRPSNPSRRVYKEREWVKEEEHRPLLPQEIGRVHFEMERTFLLALKDPKARKMNWEMMTNLERNEWVREMREDDKPPLVQKLHDAIHPILDPLGM